MSDRLLEAIERMVDEHGTEGAIEVIMTTDWPLDTKDRAIGMLEKRQRANAIVEPGEYKREEFFQ